MAPTAAIWMITYNHEKYIAQAIESVLSQKTNFEFKLFIGEDCSTDSTREICIDYQVRYPGKIQLLMNEKNDLVKNSLNTYKACFNSGAKYIALLEGDDYWTDPFKLQKQIDILQANPECTGSFHLTQQIFQDGNKGTLFGTDVPDLLNAEDTITTSSPFHTSSFLFRNVIRQLPDWFFTVVSCDMALFSIISSYGPLIKIHEIMSVYRKHDSGLCNTSSVLNNYHLDRIKLIRCLNKYHGFKYNSKAMQVISDHQKNILADNVQLNRINETIGSLSRELPVNVKNVPTMLSVPEREYLYLLSRDYWRGCGEIVDAGCFLGGSTLALGMGVLANKRSVLKEKVIHSYDLFLADEHQSSSYLKQYGNYSPGDSLREIFDKNTREVSNLLNVYEGDLSTFNWRGDKIEILFIDVSKTWELNDFLIKEFFPYLIPNHSIVIQQDFVHPTCPWLAIAMEYFKEYFEPIAYVPANSVSYLFKKEIPEHLINEFTISKLPANLKLTLMDQAINRYRILLSKDDLVELECARAILKLWLLGLDEAEKDLTRIKIEYAESSRLQGAIEWVIQRISSERKKLSMDNKFINPQLTADNIDLYYIRTAIKSSIDRILPELKGIVVDLGCGEMPYRKYILENSNTAEYIGVDIENVGYQGKTHPDVFWDGKTLPLEDASVDFVIATELFEHLPNLPGVLKEINRILKVSGKIFFTTPFLWPLHDTPYDECRYTPFSLNRILKEAGFGEVSIKAHGGWNASLAQMIGLWLKRSDAGSELKNALSGALIQLYTNLVNTDIIPEKFQESQMITGYSGTACKQIALERVKVSQTEITNSNNNKCLAVFTPFLGALSETFIKKHIDLLAPGKTVIVTGNIQNNFNNLPVLRILWTEGAAKYTPDTETLVYNFLTDYKVTHILVEYGCQGTEIVEMNLRRMQLPIFIHFHGYDASQMLRRQDVVEYYKWMSRNVSGIIACSFSMAERLSDAGLCKDNIQVNHYGIDVPNEFSQSVEETNCRFVFVGRLVPKKAPVKLLQAFLLASKQINNISLDIIGDEGLSGKKSPLLPGLKNFIQENKLEHLVKLHGAQDHAYVKNILRSSSVYVQHSITDPETGDQEGLPNSILEAASFGLPVISTIHSGIPEEVEDGITGYLVEENDIGDMAYKMVYLAQRPYLRKQMGDKGRKKILKEFTTEFSIQNLQRIIFSEQKLNKNVMNTAPGISVIIPSYNRANLIERAVRSVQEQTIPVSEIIIVDDASTDNTAEVVNKLGASDARIQYLRLKNNSGAQVARNTGIKNAHFEWIAFLDSDDTWFPERVENALDAADAERADVVYSNYIRRDPDGQEVLVNPPQHKDYVYKELLKGSFVTFPGLFVKSNCFEETGYLDESMKSWQEWDTALKLSKLYRFAYDKHPGFIWNWHDGDTISKDNKRELVGYLQIVLKYKDDIVTQCGHDRLEYHLTNVLRKIDALHQSPDLAYLRDQVSAVKTKFRTAVLQSVD